MNYIINNNRISETNNNNSLDFDCMKNKKLNEFLNLVKHKNILP